MLLSVYDDILLSTNTNNTNDLVHTSQDYINSDDIDPIDEYGCVRRFRRAEKR